MKTNRETKGILSDSLAFTYSITQDVCIWHTLPFDVKQWSEGYYDSFYSARLTIFLYFDKKAKISDDLHFERVGKSEIFLNKGDTLTYT